jgi:type III secretory pathway component EscT
VQELFESCQNILYKSPVNFRIFLNSKSIYLRHLKIFSKVLNMFLCSLGAKSFLGFFLEFLEPSRYFLDIKNDFSLF